MASTPSYISAQLAGTAGLLKTGEGTLTLTGNNTYTGTTVITGNRPTLADAPSGTLPTAACYGAAATGFFNTPTP